MVDNEDKPLAPGPAFGFVRALENVNLQLLKINEDEKNLFDVVLMSSNHAQCTVRFLNSIRHHGLNIERICTTAGRPVTGYLQAYSTNLYLSADGEKVKEATEQGIPAATLMPNTISSEMDELRVAFDGDAVLFSDEADVIAKMQKKFRDDGGHCPIRTYLVTARSAASAGGRAMKTLRTWGLEIDEAFFMAGAPKGPLLREIKPHIFFDDQVANVQSGLEFGLPAAHVPWGVANEAKNE